MLIPQVLGVRLHGELPEGATATDLVLTVTQLLREHGVVGMFVEFYGAGLAGLPIADRATIGNMSPEFGSTCAIFPIDAETLSYLALSGRPPEQIALVEAYAREQGLWHDERSEQPTFSETLELDLAEVEPSIAGPKRPQDRVALSAGRDSFREALGGYVPGLRRAPMRPSAESFPSTRPSRRRRRPGARAAARDGGPSLRVATEAAPAAWRSSRARGTLVTLADGTEVGARPRRRGDRGDHQLHQHIQPVGDDRRRHPRAQRGRAGVCARPVGQDLAGPRVEGGHRVPRPRRAHRAAGGARLQSRRLRLHHLHRQLRPALAGDLRRP